MVKLDILAGALAGLRPVQVQRRRCLAALSPHAACTRCQAVCPEGAITLTPAPVLAECSSCGLCAAVCPGDALSLDDPSDHQLLRQISTVARRTGTVSIGCKPGAAVQVTCPGRVPAELLLAAVAAGAERLELVCPLDACNTCAYAEGRNLACRAVQTAASILTSLGRPEAVALVARPSPERPRESRSVQGPVHQDRRDFLLAAFGLLRQQVPAYVPGARPAPPDNADAAARSPRRDLLLWACETLNPTERPPSDWPGNRPRLTALCQQCGICVRLCPGQALSIGETGLAHLPRRCMSCGLCAAVCPAGALEMSQTGTLADLMPANPRQLGRTATLTCGRCGDRFAATLAALPRDPRCLPCHIRGSTGEDWLS